MMNNKFTFLEKIYIETFRTTYQALFQLTFLFLTSFAFAQKTTTVVLPGTSGTWLVPCGVTSITVEAWGGGGGGGVRSNLNYAAGPGGGGGAYGKVVLNVEPGQIYSYTVGAGGVGKTDGSPTGTNPTSFPNWTNVKDGKASTFSRNGESLIANGGGGALDNTTNNLESYTVGPFGSTITRKFGQGGTATNSFTGSSFTGINGSTGASSSGSTSGAGGSAGGTSSSPGGNGGTGVTSNSDGRDGFLYGGAGSGGSKNSFTVRNGGKGADGGIRVTYTITPLVVSPATAIASNPSGTNIGCTATTVKLTAQNGSTGVGFSNVWYEGTVCPTFKYINEFTETITTYNTTQGTLLDGNKTLTADNNDPMIDMTNVLTAPFDYLKYKYITVRYRVAPPLIAGNLFEIYFSKDGGADLNEGKVVRQAIISDGNWHIINIDMSDHAQWNSNNITGWRFDYATMQGTIIDIDYLLLGDTPILDNIQDLESIISVSPTTLSTAYGVLKISEKIGCDGSFPISTCKSITIKRNDRNFVGNTGNWSDASKWTPGNVVPTVANCVNIPSGSFVTVDVLNAEALSLTVQNGGSIKIPKDQALTVNTFIKNQGDGSNFVVASDGNLLQTNESVNDGKITVKRDANLKRLDYNYWASPVKNQNLKTFSPGTVASRFLTYLETDDKFYPIAPATNIFGNNDNGLFESAAKGYAIRADNNYPSAPIPTEAPIQLFKGEFLGQPNNGQILFPLQKSGKGYNLVGNPYASNLNFYTLVGNNESVIENIAYFWTNVNANGAMQGSNYPENGLLNNYAILNGSGGVPSTTTAENGSEIPTENIRVGQGFIVQAKSAGIMTFSNGIRNANNDGSFFNKVVTDRFWLQLKTPFNIVTTQLIAYKSQATNGFERSYDAPLMIIGADAFYSTLDSYKLAIQGKASFVREDVVTLGSSHYALGEYSISLGKKEGIFANGQNIYLKDKQTGTFTNLSEGDYTFNASKGITEGRFEIVYQPENVLVTDASAKDGLVVYRDGGDFVIKSFAKNISQVEVYDASGRLMTKVQNTQKEIRLDASGFVNGMYLLKIDQQGTVTTKKIRK